MGLTLYSNKSDIDLPYSGFTRLRKFIALLTNDEIGRHYENLDTAPYFENQRERWFKEYDAKTQKLLVKYPEYAQIMSFLYMPDCDGSINLDTTRQLLKIVEKHDTNVIFGYPGRNDPATFGDFKRILQECIEDCVGLRWS